MAIKALHLGRTRPYVSRFDDGEYPTKWTLGTLTSRNVGRIRDSVTSVTIPTGKEAAEEVKTTIERTKMAFDACACGIMGWENFVDGDGKVIPYETVERQIGGITQKVVPSRLLDMIPLPVIMELSEQIMGDNVAEEEDAGNSPAPSSGASSIQIEDAEIVD